MKKTVLLIILLILFTAVPSVFSQIASVHYAEAFPELCLWVNHVPFVMAENAESVRVSEWEESTDGGINETGYTELIYEGNFLVKKTGYTRGGEREFTMSYVYDDGYLVQMKYDFPLYDSITDYYYEHYNDRIEIHMAEAGDAASSREWIKTLRYDEDNFLTEIEGPDWSRVFYYDDGFLVRAEEQRWGETYTTIYTYTENALLESITVDGEYDVFISYNEDMTIAGVYLQAYYDTAVDGDLEVQLNERGDISRLGPNEIQWEYKDK